MIRKVWKMSRKVPETRCSIFLLLCLFLTLIHSQTELCVKQRKRKHSSCNSWRRRVLVTFAPTLSSNQSSVWVKSSFLSQWILRKLEDWETERLCDPPSPRPSIHEICPSSRRPAPFPRRTLTGSNVVSCFDLRALEFRWVLIRSSYIRLN